MVFTIVDIETTGLSHYRHKIIEIGAAKFSGKRVVDRFESLVNPGVEIPSFISSFTGIDDEMVSGAPEIGDVLPEFRAFLSGDVFVAHNASFDFRFLDFSFRENFGKSMMNDRLCTRKLANRIVYDLPSKKLCHVCEHLGIRNLKAHRAMGDVMATAKVLKKFLEALDKKGVSGEGVLRFQDMPCWKARKVFE